MSTPQPRNDIIMGESTTTPTQLPCTQQGTTAPPPQDEDPEPKYAGYTRFEIELEFVQCLANPHYLLHLATLTTTSPLPGHLPSASPCQASGEPLGTTATSSSQTSASVPLLQHPPFIHYLAYLQYFSRPPYTKYLNYPGPTLKNLELLQSERFRKEVLSPEVVGALAEMGRAASAVTAARVDHGEGGDGLAGASGAAGA